jgi:Tfp pilus assembly protein PilV
MKKYAGIALLEVLISMGIIALVLLSLLSYQIAMIKNLDQLAFKTVALIQLVNFSEMLLANSSDRQKNAALARWNQDNAHLLPQGVGDFNPEDDHQCEISVQWFFVKLNTESMTVYC